MYNIKMNEVTALWNGGLTLATGHSYSRLMHNQTHASQNQDVEIGTCFLNHSQKHIKHIERILEVNKLTIASACLIGP